MPQKICSDCHRKCSEWQLFRGLCHQSDRLLRTMLRPSSSGRQQQQEKPKTLPKVVEKEVEEASPIKETSPPNSAVTCQESSPESPRKTRTTKRSLPKDDLSGREPGINNSSESPSLSDSRSKLTKKVKVETVVEPSPQVAKATATNVKEGRESTAGDCPVCQVKLANTERLRDHLRIHLDEEVRTGGSLFSI